jgi:4-aminobutyrate aminotransferase / (S)-3-amino-2-methylpropionate transaminase / 5-aminovalerate transaminase
MVKDEELIKKDSIYCSYGDTVHYAEPPKIFRGCEGSFLYDSLNIPYLDLQMWYSAASFGYKNPRLGEVFKTQINTLPQLACQYLHEEKVLLAEKICLANMRRFKEKGRIHFNVGGAQAIEDALKLVRNAKGKNLMFAFMGSYHGRTLGASAITSSYRYRRRYGHFSDRAQFIPYPYCFRCYYGKKREDCDFYCIAQFEKLFETEYYSIIDTKVKESEYAAFFVEPIQATGGYIVPPKGYFKRFKKVLDDWGILFVDDEIQMGICRAGKLWAIENFEVSPDIIVFGKALTNGLNPLSGIWAREALISPSVFPPGSTHSTFSSNPLGTRIALEVMAMLDEEDYEKKVSESGTYFLSLLQDLKKKHREIGDVDGLGLAFRVEICKSDSFTPDRELAEKMFLEGLKGTLSHKGSKYGLVLDIGGYYKNVFTLAPSLHITRGEMEMAVELFDQLISKCKKA